MTKISIKNYQSIRDIDFIIDGFTVIIGKNNIGKSAIIRAVEAALTNQTGKKFLRKGTKKAIVNIDINDLKLEWEKDASTATYKIEGYNETFSKLKGIVPKPIIDAGFYKIQIGTQKSLPQIAEQFQPLFLINQTGTVITEVIASMYQIDTLSKADDLCQKFIKSQKTLLKMRESDLNELQLNLNRFKDFEEIKKEARSLINIDNEIQKLKTEISDITTFEQELKRLTESLNNLNGIKEVNIPDDTSCNQNLLELKWLQDIEKKYNESLKLTENLKGIPDINMPNISKILQTFKEVLKIKELDNSLIKSSTEITRIEEFINLFDIDEINNKMKDLSHTLTDFTSIFSIEKELIKTVKDIKIIKKQLQDTNIKFTEANEQMKSIKICPLCERPF